MSSTPEGVRHRAARSFKTNAAGFATMAPHSDRFQCSVPPTRRSRSGDSRTRARLCALRRGGRHDTRTKQPDAGVYRRRCRGTAWASRSAWAGRRDGADVVPRGLRARQSRAEEPSHYTRAQVGRQRLSALVGVDDCHGRAQGGDSGQRPRGVLGGRRLSMGQRRPAGFRLPAERPPGERPRGG